MATTPQFAIGEIVAVLHAIRLPREHLVGFGIVERITFQSSDGEPLYWIKGFPVARTARVLRHAGRGYDVPLSVA